jgi:hypothetical protein
VILFAGAAGVSLLCLTLAVVLSARAVDRELRALTAATQRLVRLAVAVDDLHREVQHVLPAIDAAGTRARTLGRPGYRELPR